MYVQEFEIKVQLVMSEFQEQQHRRDSLIVSPPASRTERDFSSTTADGKSSSASATMPGTSSSYTDETLAALERLCMDFLVGRPC